MQSSACAQRCGTARHKDTLEVKTGTDDRWAQAWRVSLGKLCKCGYRQVLALAWLGPRLWRGSTLPAAVIIGRGLTSSWPLSIQVESLTYEGVSFLS